MPQEKHECISMLIHSRRAARNALRELERIHQAQRQSRRRARQYRKSGNPILIRNAEVIEARSKEHNPDIKYFSELLVFIGRSVRLFADDIDSLLTTRELFDLLEVNPVDRARVGPTEGFTKIVFVHGLEDSATHRGSWFKDGPLFQAMIEYMNHLTDNDPELRQKMDDGLFGKGGLLEFVPTYRRGPDGDFVRNPPKLRLADATTA